MFQRSRRSSIPTPPCRSFFPSRGRNARVRKRSLAMEKTNHGNRVLQLLLQAVCRIYQNLSGTRHDYGAVIALARRERRKRDHRTKWVGGCGSRWAFLSHPRFMKTRTYKTGCKRSKVRVSAIATEAAHTPPMVSYPPTYRLLVIDAPLLR